MKKCEKICNWLCGVVYANFRYPKTFVKPEVLTLFCGSVMCVKFLRKMSSIVIPEINSMTIGGIYTRDKYVGRIIEKCFPQKVHTLQLCSGTNLTPIRILFPQLMKLSINVKEIVNMSGFEINERQFKRILAAFRHIKSVSIKRSKFLIPNIPNLSLALNNTKIKKLNFDFCGKEDNSNWKENPQEFINLIKGISKSPQLTQSLNSLSAINSFSNPEQIRLILSTTSLSHINLSL
ncbi:unnamed protein product [Moneuplotes crassus]|uniref:Uncharacterized protein n=1 Tax=Euplotes crassus TaxID=5936 RepID=A0AAD1UK43_EUPCR|nr:unnamed protein product [Moneuplotes crassus]